VANDPFCAALAERARLPLAAPGDLASWTVFVVRGPGEGEGGGFSRSLNWLLSLAGRRAVVSPAWLAEAARAVEEREAGGEERRGGDGAKRRRKAGDGAAAAAALEDPPVLAPPTAPFALRDPAAESRGRFSLDPVLLCGWDDGEIPVSSSGKEAAATAATAAAAAAGKRKAPEAGAEAGAPSPPAPSRPPRLCDGVTVAPSSALLACESDNGGMLCALIEAAGGRLARPVRTRNDGRATAEAAAFLRAAAEREARARAAAVEAAAAAAKTPGGAPSEAAAAATAPAVAATPLFAATPAAAATTATATPASTTAIAPGAAAAAAAAGEGAAEGKRRRARGAEAEWLGLACSADSARERAWARENLPRGTRVLGRTAFVDAVIRQRLPAPESKGVLFLAGE
jgi:hypothetical protein